jgi:hypothetical protein
MYTQAQKKKSRVLVRKQYFARYKDLEVNGVGALETSQR